MTLSCCLVKGKLICENRGRIIRGITIHKGKKQSFHISREKLTHSRSSPWPLVEMSRIRRCVTGPITHIAHHERNRDVFYLSRDHEANVHWNQWRKQHGADVSDMLWVSSNTGGLQSRQSSIVYKDRLECWS